MQSGSTNWVLTLLAWTSHLLLSSRPKSKLKPPTPVLHSLSLTFLKIQWTWNPVHLSTTVAASTPWIALKNALNSLPGLQGTYNPMVYGTASSVQPMVPHAIVAHPGAALQTLPPSWNHTLKSSNSNRQPLTMKASLMLGLGFLLDDADQANTSNLFFLLKPTL